MEGAPKSCLLCSTEVESTCLSSPLVGRFPGSEGCPLLEKELERVFILRCLLDIPSNFCEGIVGQDGSWFEICGKCYSSKVVIAWEIHQQSLALEEKMRRLKKVIKEEMKGRRKDRMMSGGVDDLIREYLFPERIVTAADVKVEITTAREYDNEDNVSNYSFNMDPPSPEQDEPPPKRKRGRPKRTEGSGVPNRKRKLDMANPLMKRKRGRPPKNRVEADIKTEENLLTSTGDTPQLSDPPKKRKPGRPRIFENGLPKKKVRKPGASSEFYRNPHGILKRKTFHWIHCPSCKSRFRQPEELEAHKVAHQLSLETGGQFDCALCTYPGRDLNDLERHRRIRHMVGVKSVKKMHHCTQCTSFKTMYWKMLKTHYEQKHPAFVDEAQPTCEVCSMSFRSPQALAHHVGREHPEKMPPEAVTKVETVIINCEQCSMKFPSRQTLLLHIKTIHERQNKHICSECGKGFQYMKDLDQHVITHDKEGRRDFICHLCGCDYPVERTLMTHYRKVHEQELQGDGGTPAQNKFQCKYCDLESPYKVVISRHMKEHKKELGHRCQLCGKYYFNAAGLKLHLKINHPLTEEKVECPYCKKEFSNLQYMKDHLRKYCKIKNLGESSGGGAGSSSATTTSTAISQPMPMNQMGYGY